MTAPKTYKRYATQWLELFDGFVENPSKVHVVHCPSYEKAQALRSEFYKARGAFLKDPDMRSDYEGVLNSKEVLIRGRDVVFECKDNNWAGKLIGDSLRSNEGKGEGDDDILPSETH